MDSRNDCLVLNSKNAILEALSHFQIYFFVNFLIIINKQQNIFIRFTTFKLLNPNMKHFVVFLFLLSSTFVLAQTKEITQTVTGIILNDNNLKPISNVNIINVNMVKGTTSNDKGYFEISARLNDTLHITILGYKSLRLKVTNDWIKNKKNLRIINFSNYDYACLYFMKNLGKNFCCRFCWPKYKKMLKTITVGSIRIN